MIRTITISVKDDCHDDNNNMSHFPALVLGVWGTGSFFPAKLVLGFKVGAANIRKTKNRHDLAKVCL